MSLHDHFQHHHYRIPNFFYAPGLVSAFNQVYKRDYCLVLNVLKYLDTFIG